MELKVEVSRDGETFVLFNEYERFDAVKGKRFGLRSIYAQLKHGTLE